MLMSTCDSLTGTTLLSGVFLESPNWLSEGTKPSAICSSESLGSSSATAQFANTLFLLRTGRGEGEQTAFELLLCFLGLRLTIGEAIGGSCTVSSPKTRFMNAGNFARRHSLKHSGRN